MSFVRVSAGLHVETQLGDLSEFLIMLAQDPLFDLLGYAINILSSFVQVNLNNQLVCTLLADRIL